MITKLKFKIELLISHIKSKFLFILIGVIIGIAALVFHKQIISLYQTPKFHTKIIGIEGLYSFNNLPEEILTKISYGLTQTGEDDRPKLSPIVKSYQLVNNNLDYIFTLNTDLYWQNGKKLTASDIDYQIEGATITPISENVLKISLKNAFAPLMTVLSKPLLKKNMIGLGDYQVESITYQEGSVSTIKLTPQSYQNPTLLYRFYPSAQDLTDAYKLGAVDEIHIYTLPQELENWNKTKITQEIETTRKYSAIFFNTQKISNRQTRQALAYATPKNSDKNARCISPISPTSWAYNPNVKTYDYNPNHAKELFSKNKIESINLAVTDRNLLPVAEDIKHAWQTNLELNTTITMENQIDFNNFEAVLSYGSIPHDPDQYLFWHSTQSETNVTKINNSRIDKLLEEGRLSFDPQERKQIYQDFQRYLLEEIPVVFLSYPTKFTISRLK